MLFHFKLRPLEDVAPWGDEKPELHWFGLTDGWCWWEVGEQQLFRFSQAWIDHWANEYPDLRQKPPYVDYQVVRPWEDLLQCLPAILDSVPDDLVDRVQDDKNWQSLRDHAFDLAMAQNDDAIWNALERAFQ